MNPLTRYKYLEWSTMETTSADVEELAVLVKAFRAKLVHCGYRHGNSSGELTNVPGDIWVRTSYSSHEFVVDTWTRPDGRAAHENHERLRVHTGFEPLELDLLAGRLCEQIDGVAA